MDTDGKKTSIGMDVLRHAGPSRPGPGENQRNGHPENL